MFGYVMINRPELKIKEYETYQGYYCGLCRMLKNDYGLRGRMVLSYDMTFLTLLLTGLYEPKEHRENRVCFAHPGKKHLEITNECSRYAADMNILLTYYKLLDDWQDEKELCKLGLAGILQTQAKKVTARYPQKAERIRYELKRLGRLEAAGEKNLDRVSGCFGKLTEELFVYRRDEWETSLRRFGFFLGKYIYLADAYEDIQKDEKKREYNPFFAAWNEKYKNSQKKEKQNNKASLAGEFQKENSYWRICAMDILKMMMAECAKEFERLPIVKNAELMRNILYAGVWVRLLERRTDKPAKQKACKKGGKKLI